MNGFIVTDNQEATLKASFMRSPSTAESPRNPIELQVHRA